MIRKYTYIFLLLCVFCSCEDSNKKQIVRLVKEWEGKEVTLPNNIIFTKYGIDTLDYQLPMADYTIVSYTDSLGCTSCKLQFHRWKQIMHEMDSVAGTPISHLFVFHPKNKQGLSELNYLMKRDKFDYPVWIDNEDRFNKTNNLPVENAFHTLLLDRNNKVVAMGSPFLNPSIKDLYLKIICGDFAQKSPNSSQKTEVALAESVIDLGEFDWTSPQQATFTLYNKGNNRLAINDIVASCGCISVEYSQVPVEPGKDATINVTYKADKPEYFSKTLKVYANVGTPLQLTLKGSAH